MEEPQKHPAEPNKSDIRMSTGLFYLHKFHEQPNYSLVAETGTVVTTKRKSTGNDVRKFWG